MVQGVKINNVKDPIPKEGDPKKKTYGELQLTEGAYLKWDPVPFDAFGKIMRTTNKRLAEAIKRYFGKTFHDIRGVNIRYEPSGGPKGKIQMEMYFSKNNQDMQNGTISNLIDISNPNGDGEITLYDKKKMVENRMNGHHFILNDETKLLIAPFLKGGKGANLPTNRKKWNNISEEIWTPSNNFTFAPMSNECLIRVRDFDIYKVLKQLYGIEMVSKLRKVEDHYEMDDPVKASYEVRFIRYMFNDPNVFIMHIEQFDEAKVHKFTLDENPMRRPMNGGIIYYG